MNWGKGITIAMILFIAFIVTTVIIVVRQDDSLVETDYYEKGINYSTQMEREARGKQVITTLSNTELSVDLPESGKINHVRMINMANSDFDREFDVANAPLDTLQVIELKELEKGQWSVEVEGIMKADTFIHKTTQWIR